MRLLLDECVDRRLARDIVGHEVSTVGDLGWAGVKNGALLARAAGQFDVFVTVDETWRSSSGSKVYRLLLSSSTRDPIAFRSTASRSYATSRAPDFAAW